MTRFVVLGRSPDVVLDFPVADVNGAVGVCGNVGFVRHEHDGVAGLVQLSNRPMIRVRFESRFRRLSASRIEGLMSARATATRCRAGRRTAH
jgi:hypothetical protein